MAQSIAQRSRRVVVLGVPVDALTVDDLHDRLRQAVGGRACITVLHVNAHALNLACRHDGFAGILRRADVVLCDGHGVRLAARALGQDIPVRITYAEWAWQLAALCETEGWRLFLLGAADGVAAEAAARLRDRHPALHVAGTAHGYFDKRPGSRASADVVDAINTSGADVVLVGFGMPMQEQWVSEHRARIQAPVVLTGGAVFDYVAGRVRRPPRFMTRNGLEWLGRLWLEPRRLAGRYLVGNPEFVARVLHQRWRERRARHARGPDAGR
ncbi:MAG TPA: WecB/TagA/CpsF family glycosyltransferase [Gemmatimonadales bacterium]|nr:WecB/TagA/CpsF family glycosyltransferase [Gemmatimonadales bacterium]